MGTVPVQSAIFQIREELAVTNRVNIWTPNGDLDVAVSWTAFKLWRRQSLAPKRSDGDLRLGSARRLGFFSQGPVQCVK
jgi:hypothetical protein